MASSKGIGTSKNPKPTPGIQPFKSYWRLDALSGGVLAWWVPQSGAHCAYQPKQCPRGVLRPSSYAQLSRLRPTTRHSDQKDRSQPSARRMDMNRGAASPPEVVIGQQQQQTFNVYGLVRRETPCSRAVAMSRGPSEVSVGAVLRSRHIRIGHPRKRPSRFCDREKHIPYVDCPFTCASAA